MAAAVAVGLVQFRMRLQIAWRQWLTGELSPAGSPSSASTG